MTLLYPYPYQIFSLTVVAFILWVLGFPLYWVYCWLMDKLNEQNRRLIKRIQVVLGILLVTIVFTGGITTLIKNHQVNKQMGFQTATPETPEGEPFLVIKIVEGKTMDLAGLHVDDQILYPAVNDLYKLLANNQGKEVEIPIRRDGEEISLKVRVPEMEIMEFKFWPFNKY